ncbi:MAG: hypothetical protein HOH43_01215 [Candidatus Latescibacteria bacterium]|nr:hypothetical protein [Candidatus Latescibacterota bacterium]
MKIRHYVLMALLFVVAIFVTANWNLVTTPSTLNFLVQDVEAPIGVVLCAVILLQSLVFLVFLAHLETSAALQHHGRIKETEKLRKIADAKEASRIHELEERIDTNFEELFKILDQVIREESLEDLRTAMENDSEKRQDGES